MGKSHEAKSSRCVPKFAAFDVEKFLVKMGSPVGNAYRGPDCIHRRCHLDLVSLKDVLLGPVPVSQQKAGSR